MTVESQSNETVQLLANEVYLQMSNILHLEFSFLCQVRMVDQKHVPKNFLDLLPEETDLTMFSIQNLTLVKSDQLVIMAIVLKRKVATELLTTYLPTILLLLITFVTIFFDKDLFGDAIAVNLTIMLVMTTIFTSKIEELPPTSDMKMIDIWLIFCLVVPFLEVVLRTSIECMNCSCHICEANEGPSSGEVLQAWVGKGEKEKVAKYTSLLSFDKSCDC